MTLRTLQVHGSQRMSYNMSSWQTLQVQGKEEVVVKVKVKEELELELDLCKSHHRCYCLSALDRLQ